ncbi:MAG: ferredoxin [Nitrospiria bacterium]
MGKYRHHVFVCINERDANDPRGCCAAKGSFEIRDAFKEEIFKRGLKGIVRANQAGCLDACVFGPSVVVYPGGTWYRVKNREDVLEVVEKHLEGGKIVESLLIPRSWAKG